MSINRAAFAVLMVTYVLINGGPEAWVSLLQLGLGAVAALAIFVHILIRPAANPIRRTLAMMSDLGTICFQMHQGGASGSLFYPLVLWTIFGNGFRFGLPSLLTATAVGFVGFCAVVFTTAFWSEHVHLSIGLTLGALILPLYAGTLISKLSRATARAEKARRTAEEANAAKSIFLASVSHELRTPLNAIIGLGGLLLETELNASQSEAARTIDTAAKSLLAMIDGVLDFSRIEAGRMPASNEPFDLLELVAHTRRLFAAQTRAKGLSLAVHVAPGTPLDLRGDRRHLGEILFNLVGNAVKFTGRGGVLIAVEACQIGEGASGIRFEVADTGIGVAADAQGKIFEPFTQADATIVNRFGGTGLGLSLCKKLVELLGGSIGVRSAPGDGSTFFFEVPAEPIATGIGDCPPSVSVRLSLHDPQLSVRLHRLGALLGVSFGDTDMDPLELGRSGGVIAVADALECLVPHSMPRIAVLEDRSGPVPPDLRWLCETAIGSEPTQSEFAQALRIANELSEIPRSVNATHAKPVAVPVRPLRILVAEDNRTNQLVITKILEHAGHSARIVGDGEAALVALASERFDLVLMDVNMPTMTGIEATKLYRFGELGMPRVPILALTADATGATATMCREAGMDACITKPVEPRYLLDTIARHVAGVPAPVEERSREVAPRRAKPNLRLVTAVDLDPQVAADLEALGGQEFVTSIYREFVSEADDLLDSLEVALRKGDFQTWRAHAHGLRSAAVNVGAKRLVEICTPLEAASLAAFESDAPAQLESLRVAAADLRAAIQRRGSARRAAL